MRKYDVPLLDREYAVRLSTRTGAIGGSIRGRAGLAAGTVGEITVAREIGGQKAYGEHYDLTGPGGLTVEVKTQVMYAHNLPPHPQNPVYMSNLSWSAAGRAGMLAFCMTTPALLQCYVLGYMASVEFMERGREFREMMGTKIRRPVWGVTVGELRESIDAAENWKAEESKTEDRQASAEPDADQVRPATADTGGGVGPT